MAAALAAAGDETAATVSVRRARAAAAVEAAPPATGAATAVLERAPEAAAATRVRVPTIPRREPAKPLPRRPRGGLGAVAAVLLLLLAAATAITLLATAGSDVKVPDVLGARRAAATRALRRLGLKPTFRVRYSEARTGSAVAQSPKAGARVSDGSTVGVVLSKGPPPVPVPALVGKPGGQAGAVLGGLGLRATLTAVPAPGVAPGLVTRESPVAGTPVRRGSAVVLDVAEQPRWRALTSFSGEAGGHSVPFRILGRRWRVIYTMGYQGICTFVFFCSGPSARVLHPAGDATVTQFDLGDGTDQTRVFTSGPGLYEIAVTPGSDTAKWSVQVEDYY
jgi:hypothetical protein